MINLPNGVKLAEIPSLQDKDYMAGDDGRIYSCKRNIEWYPLKGGKNRQYYTHIVIYRNGKAIGYLIHRLICEAFHGPAPEGKKQVRHLDGNPENNKPENLAWGTGFENWADKKRHGRGYEGEKHPQAKLTNFEREAIKWVVKNNIASIRQIARMLNMNHSSISQICKQENYVTGNAG